MYSFLSSYDYPSSIKYNNHLVCLSIYLSFYLYFYLSISIFIYLFQDAGIPDPEGMPPALLAKKEVEREFLSQLLDSKVKPLKIYYLFLGNCINVFYV